MKPAVKGEVKPAVKGEVKGSALLKDLNSSSTSSSYESFYSAHNRVFGFDCNPFQAQKLGAYIDQDGMEEAVVIRAIERAALASSGYNFNLIAKILDDYFRSGAKTIDQAKAIDNQFETRKADVATTPKNRKGKTSFAEMAREMSE
ncbi:Replication initiation and membrane attachment [compost metagenome]